MTSKPTQRVELSELHDTADWERLAEEVQATKEPRLLFKDGKPLAELRPAPPPRRRRKAQRPMSPDDPLWGLAGSAVDAAPTDSSRKLEYLGEAYP